MCIALLVGCSDPFGKPSNASSSAPPPSSSSPTTTAPQPISYQIQRGDTVSAIARRFHVSIDTIVAANHLPSADTLTPGQTLQIPPPPPRALAVTPPSGPRGTGFQVKLEGAQPAEIVRFEIDAPSGKKFSGPPHTASPAGEVNATYQTNPADPAGTYTVIATGDQGTSATVQFTVTGP
jgi:LysM repeat protein